MKEMKKYRTAPLSFGHLPEGKAPLSFGHLPEGERAAAGLPVRQGSRNPVSDFLFLIIYFLFPKKENNEHRIRNVESGSRKTEDGRPKLVSDSGVATKPVGSRLSPFVKGDESRVLGTEGVKNPSPATTTKENKEHRIRNAESGSFGNLQPASCNKKTEQPGHTMTSSHSMTAKYKVSSHLPRGGFYSGDCPGAAAITIILSLFSSPRVTPIFAGTTQKNLPVANLQALHRSSFVPLNEGDEIRFSESGGKNRKTLQQGTFVPLENPEGILRRSPSDLRKGDEISRWLSGLVAGSEGVQEVSTTTPKIRMKGFLKERRYAVT